MDTVTKVGLAELGYLERELSWSVQEAATRLGGDDLAARVREFGEAHARNAETVERIMRDERAASTHVPGDFKSAVRRLTDGLKTAPDRTSTLVALVQAERHIVDFYEVPLGEPLTAQDAAALRQQQHEEQRHVDYLEGRGAVEVPELADLGDADGSGSAEQV